MFDATCKSRSIASYLNGVQEPRLPSLNEGIVSAKYRNPHFTLDNTRHFIVTKSLKGVQRSVGVKSVCRSSYESHFLWQHIRYRFGLLRVSEVLALQANHVSQNQLGQFWGVNFNQLFYAWVSYSWVAPIFPGWL